MEHPGIFGSDFPTGSGNKSRLSFNTQRSDGRPPSIKLVERFSRGHLHAFAHVSTACQKYQTSADERGHPRSTGPSGGLQVKINPATTPSHLDFSF